MCTASRFVAVLIASQFIWFNSLYAQRIEFERVASLSNYVSEIAQDDQGFMWFGGMGMHRYDGYTYTSYYHDADDSTSLSSDYVTNILVDSQGEMWVGTRGSRWLLNLFDPVTKSFRRFSPGDSTTNTNMHSVLCMYEDSAGYIWVSTNSSELYQFDRDTQSFTTYTVPGRDRFVQAIVERSDGSLWVGVSAPNYLFNTGDLYIIDKDKGKLHEVKDWYDPEPGKPKEITALYEDASANLWLGTWPHGLIHFDSRTRTDTSVIYTYDTRLNDILEDDKGRLWLAYAEEGLKVYDPVDNSFFAHRNDQGFTPINGEHAYKIFVDQQGTWWVSYLRSSNARMNVVIGAGLFKIKHSLNFTTYSYDPDSDVSLSRHQQVRSFYEKNDSTVWIALGGAPNINSFNPRSGKTKQFVDEVDSVTTSVRTFLERRNGEVWVGARRVFRYQQREDSLKLLPLLTDTLNASPILDLLEDSTGDIWIGTFRKGLYRFNKELELINHFTGIPGSTRGLLGEVVFAINEDKQGAIWVSTRHINSVNYFGVLHKFDRVSNTFERFFEGIKAFYGAIPYEDGTGGYWLTTNRGLYRWHPDLGVQQHYSIENGLPHDQVICLIEDSRGVLWLTTGMGLASLNPETDVIRTYFSREEFLESPMSSDPNSCFRSSDGTVYIGRSPGFTVFNPDDLVINEIPPEVVLTSVQIAGDSLGYPLIDADGIIKVELVHSKNDLAITFAGLHYEEASENTYSYMLDGFNEEWVYIGRERVAHFSQLSPGEYTFWGRAANPNGVWSEERALLSIIIHPPWWRTLWAYALYGVLFIVGIVSLNKIQRQRLIRREQQQSRIKIAQYEANAAVERAKLAEQLEEVKSRFFINMAHEIQTPLTLIIGPVNDALQGTYGPIAPRLKQQLDVVLRNGDRLVQLINQLLDIERLEAGGLKLQAANHDLVAFVRALTLSFVARAEREMKTVSFETAETELYVYYDVSKLEKILINLLSNAFKFTEENASIRVSVGQEDDNALISIQDTGVGISQENLTFVFDRFYQVDPSSTRQFEGSGIGLALAKEFVELHKGRITATSKEGEGSLFTVLLPLGRAHLHEDQVIKESDSSEHDEKKTTDVADEAHTTGKEKNDTKAKEAKTGIVLIVEDNKDVREYLKTHLDRFEVVEAENGTEGLHKALTILPDLIISDIMMPEMDGYAFVSGPS